jgi:hypothetical protein
LGLALARLGEWTAARDELLIDEAEADWTAASVELALVEVSSGRLGLARQAFDRAVARGRPPDDYAADQMLYEGVGALLDAATGKLDAAAATVRPFAVVPRK